MSDVWSLDDWKEYNTSGEQDLESVAAGIPVARTTGSKNRMIAIKDTIDHTYWYQTAEAYSWHPHMERETDVC